MFGQRINQKEKHLLCGDVEENPVPIKTSKSSIFHKVLDPSQSCV